MKAQVLYGIGNIKYVEVDTPHPGKGEALIKVSRCGICGSDIPRIYKTGAHNMPIIPGHEFSGTVVECPDNESLVGRRVGVFPLIPCRSCPQCINRHYEMCENYNYLGSRCDGGFAEYVVAPLWNLLPILDTVTDDEAAMLEPMCVAVHAMRQVGLLDDIRDASSSPVVVICGLGTIGLLMAMFVKDAGYRDVYFIGNKNIQKAKILEMGFDKEQFCDVRYGDPGAFIMSKTGGRGADVYFECIGRPESYAQAVNLTAPLGKVMLVGNPAADMDLKREVYWKILRRQMTLKGTWNSSYYGNYVSAGSKSQVKAADPMKLSSDTDDWSYVLSTLQRWHKAGDLSPASLITHKFPLSDMERGLRIMQKKSEEYVKIMVELFDDTSV